MKKKLKLFLQKKNLYYILKYSLIFRLYQVIFKYEVVRQEKVEVAFYKSFLQSCNLIFDIGAYDGHKTEAFLKIAKKVVSCEPDQESFKILLTRFRNRRAMVFLENKAIGETEGEKKLLVHHPGSAFNTLSKKWKDTLEEDNIEKWNEKIQFSEEKIVQCVTLDSLIEKYGKPNFIKIDVEGYEENVLKGLSQPIQFLSFEGLYPEGLPEIRKCIKRIEELCIAAEYNIATYEKLLLPTFVHANKLLSWLEKNSVMHLEIIAKMKS